MKILVVGSGLSAAVIARELAENGSHITVIDKRHHIGGNCFDEEIDHVLVHRYGPHIFHTSKENVVAWINRFSEWTPYRHNVKALLENGTLVTIPANKETLATLGSKQQVVDILFRPYTKKMWGLSIEEINPAILNRVPIREDLNDLYFPEDSFQALPKNGYTKFILEILNHPNIEIKLNFAFAKHLEKSFDFIFNSMPIDEYFDFTLGRLPYRSIKFHQFTLPIPKILPVATLNYTHTGPFTRVTEWKHFPNSNSHPWQTTVTVEEPCDYSENNWEPYYPINDLHQKNISLFNKYKSMGPHYMKFIGRCGTYSYIDMDDAIDLSLNIAKRFLSK